MEGIALLGVFIAIVMLLRWLVVHDKAPNQKTLGLFAMKEPGDVPANQTLTTSRRDSRVAPQPAQPVLSVAPPSRIQN
jgi:hypothetical protein